MNELPWALEIIKGLGIAGGPVFAVLWWLERKERVECQKVTREMLTQQFVATSQSATAITRVGYGFAEFREWSKDANNTLAQAIRSIKRSGGA